MPAVQAALYRAVWAGARQLFARAVMNQDHQQFHASLEAHDDVAINPSANPALSDLLNPARRNVLKGGLTLAALGFFAGGISACRSAGASPLLGFKRSEEHTSELQSQSNLVCRLLLEKKT